MWTASAGCAAAAQFVPPGASTHLTTVSNALNIGAGLTSTVGTAMTKGEKPAKPAKPEPAGTASESGFGTSYKVVTQKGKTA